MVTAGYVRSFDAGQVTHGRAMALAMLTLSSAAITAVPSGMRTLASRVVVIVTVVLSMVLIQIRPLSALLSLTPLHPDDWLLAVGAAAIAAAVLAGFNGMRGRRFGCECEPAVPGDSHLKRGSQCLVTRRPLYQARRFCCSPIFCFSSSDHLLSRSYSPL